MPRISSPRPLDLTKPFVTSSQAYGSQPFDLSQKLVTWYRDIQGDFVPDLSGKGNTARAAGMGFQPVTSSLSVPEFNAPLYNVKSLGFGLGSSTSTYAHLTTVSGSTTIASEDHTFNDGTKDIPFSISFWIKTESISTNQYVINKLSTTVSDGIEWSVLISNDDIFFILYTSLATNYIRAYSLNIVELNTWQHFVFTYDGSESQSGMTIYKNGSQAPGLNRSANGAYGGMISSDVPICVGTVLNDQSTNLFSSQRVIGDLYSVAIWKDRVLDASEVAALYNAYLNGPGGEERSGFVSRSPRLQLRELDDLPGAYSTVRRTGDPTRTGALTSNFNDETSIIFSNSSEVVFPSMLPRGNAFASQAVDIIGQESDINASLTIRSFQQPNYLHYSPTENIGAFNENRTIPATDFFLSGTDATILPGFQSGMRSKASFEIDITPESETTFTRNVASRNASEGQPAGPNNTGFMYYNFLRREWEQIGSTDPATKTPIHYDYDLSYFDAFSFLAPSGTLPAQFSVSPSLPYVPDSEKEAVGYSKIGTPIAAFGAPNAEIYHATSSQCLKMSSLISDPFLLEAVRVEFEEVKSQRVQGDLLVEKNEDDKPGFAQLFQSGSIRDIDNYTFFVYRQSRKNRVIDSVADVSSSERYLILSGAMTFWNSASFESNRVRYVNQEVNYNLSHTPAFSYEFGLPYSSSLDTRLLDWDPSHDIYYVNNTIFNVTSNCVAHFNFESDAIAGETVPDKSGNGHIATVGSIPLITVIGPESLDPNGVPGFPTTNYLGSSFFDAGAYITNRGYLTCLAGDYVTPSMVIDHASDLQLTSGQPFSISMWVHAADITPTNQQCILSKADNSTGAQVEYSIILDTGGKIVWRVEGVDGTGSPGPYIKKTTVNPPAASGEWFHLIVSYSGGSLPTALRIFVNGVEVNSTVSSGGTFVSPVNYSHDVLVAGLGSSTETLAGFIGSLEFYNSYVLGTSARKLYLLQESPLLNKADIAVGQFTGSIDMSLRPSVCNRQSFGISSYSNNVLQNVWLGGTSFRKFNKSSWEVFTNLYPANPFNYDLTVGVAVPELDQTINDNEFSAIIDSRTLKFFGFDAAPAPAAQQQLISEIYTVNDGTDQGIESPYLLMPDDELIFGMDAGICSMRFLDNSGNISHLTGSHFVISPKRCKVTLFGSLVKNSSEFSTSLNQDLSSKSVHEVIGAEPVLDQFMTEPISSYYGSYLDEIVTGSMAIPALGGVIFSVSDQDNSRRVITRVSSGQAGITGSLQRFVKISDASERTYDSCLPDIFSFISQSNIGLTGSVATVGQDAFSDSLHEYAKFLPQQFPFRDNPTRFFEPEGDLQLINSNTTAAYDQVLAYRTLSDAATGDGNPAFASDARMRDLVFRTGWKISLRSAAAAGGLAHRMENQASAEASYRPFNSGTFRYGISNVDPEFTSTRWRYDRYGQFRDMLESRQLTARFDGFNPIKVRFVSGSSIVIDPSDTHSQNLSIFATSSMPYFDDSVARNRNDNPDESLLNLFSITT